MVSRHSTTCRRHFCFYSERRVGFCSRTDLHWSSGPVVRIHYINHPSRGNTALQSHESGHKQGVLPQGNEHQGNEPPGNRSHLRARGIRTWDGGSLCGALCTGGGSLQWAFCIGSRVPPGSLYRASGHGTKGPPAGPSAQGGGSLQWASV